MNQSDQKHQKSNVKSSIWSIAITAFLVIIFVLQSQQGQKGLPVEKVDLAQNTTLGSSLEDSKEREIQSKIKVEKDSPHRSLKPQSSADDLQTNSRPIARSPAKTKQTPANSNRPPPAGSSNSTANSQPELGQLRDLGGKVWESAAGLKYGPGSREKHRLLHIMRHAEDQPKRPGKHGVFLGEGDRKKVLALIDEAYLKALKGGRKVEKKREGNRVVYTVEMGRRIGFVGGAVGNKQGKPSASKIRLVLEGSNVITAFPL